MLVSHFWNLHTEEKDHVWAERSYNVDGDYSINILNNIVSSWTSSELIFSKDDSRCYEL